MRRLSDDLAILTNAKGVYAALFGPVEPGELVKTAVREHLSAACEKRLALKAIEPDMPPPLIEGDSPLLCRALNILLDNAICYTQPGGNIAVSLRTERTHIALCVHTNTMWGAVSGISTIYDMAAWANMNPNALPYYAIDIESLIAAFYPSCAPAWFAADGRLDEAQIEAFLAALKMIRGGWNYGAYVRSTGQDLKAAWKSMGAQIPEWNPYSVGSVGNTSIIEESIGGFMMLQGMQAQLPYLLYGVSSASMPNGIASDFIALPGQAEGCFMPILLLGASRNSVNSASARAFIAYALSDDTQAADMWEGFPVSVKALDAMLSQDTAANTYSSGGDGIEWRSKWLNHEQRKQLRDIISGLTTPVTCDFTLYQMLVSESAPFFEGRISVKEAAANLCAKANAYLSE